MQSWQRLRDRSSSADSLFLAATQTGSENPDTPPDVGQRSVRSGYRRLRADQPQAGPVGFGTGLRTGVEPGPSSPADRRSVMNARRACGLADWSIELAGSCATRTHRRTSTHNIDSGSRWVAVSWPLRVCPTTLAQPAGANQTTTTLKRVRIAGLVPHHAGRDEVEAREPVGPGGPAPLPTRGSHRPERADFPHSVRQVAALLHAA
jgi:hypothetical protein